MANLQVKDATGATVELKATGTGTALDPFVTDQTVTGVGLPTESEATTNTGSFSLIQLVKRLLNTTLLKGSQTTANALSVALPSDVATIPAGGTYNATSPTLSSGQRSELQLSSRGGLLIDTVDIVSNPNNINTVDAASTSSAGANGQSLITGNPTNNSAVSVLVSGNSSFAVLITGTWVGTLQFERSLDNATTWTAVGAFAAGTSFIVQSTTANGGFHGNSSSATHIRVRATAWTSGVASVRILAGQGTGTITVGNPVRLFDRTSGVEHTIKAGSTLPASTDTATVVTNRDTVSVRKVPGAVASTTDYATATNATATITYSAAGAGISHAFEGISFSLSGTPAAAVSLTVQDGANTVFSVDVTSSGAGFIPLLRRGTANTAMTISLGAGGSGVVGKVSVLNKFTVS